MPESPAFSQARQRAESLAAEGNLDGARALLERAVEIGRERLADGDTELLATMRQLAGVYVRADDPMAARRLLEETIEAGRRLGDTDPLAVMLAYDLAGVAEELANRHVARTNFAKVAEFGPAALGADHPAVVRARVYVEPGPASGEPAPAAAPTPTPASSPVSTSSPVPAATPVSTSPAGPAAMPVPMAAPVPAAIPVPIPAPAQAPESSTAPVPASVPVETLPPDSIPVMPPPATTTVPRSRTSWMLAGVAFVAVTVAVTAVLARSPGKAESTGSVQAAPAHLTLHDAGSSVMLLWGRPANDSVSSFAITGGPVGEAPRQLGEATANAGSFEIRGLDPSLDHCFAVIASYGSDGAATSPQACTNRKTAPPAPANSAVPSASATATPSRTVTTPTEAATATTTTAAATARTRIVSPASNRTVAWPFDAKFTVSAADASATATVVSLSICIAGRCYLDGKVDVFDGVPAPYTVYLGSTKPEGTGVAWQLRLDRISKATYDTLVAERDAAITAGTWGDTGTRMNVLNATPVSTLTVTKGG